MATATLRVGQPICLWAYSWIYTKLNSVHQCYQILISTDCNMLAVNCIGFGINAEVNQLSLPQGQRVSGRGGCPRVGTISATRYYSAISSLSEWPVLIQALLGTFTPSWKNVLHLFIPASKVPRVSLWEFRKKLGEFNLILFLYFQET